MCRCTVTQLSDNPCEQNWNIQLTDKNPCAQKWKWWCIFWYGATGTEKAIWPKSGHLFPGHDISGTDDAFLYGHGADCHAAECQKGCVSGEVLQGTVCWGMCTMNQCWSWHTNMHIWCAKLEPDEQKFEGVGRFTAEKSCCSCKTPHRIGTGNASIMNLSPLVFFGGKQTWISMGNISQLGQLCLQNSK